MTYVNDLNSKTSIRSYSENNECIKALLETAHSILTRKEFFKIYYECKADCMEW